MIFRIAYRNVKKNWRKSYAAILAIAVGFVAQSLFVGYLDNVEKLFEAMYANKQMYGDLIIEDARRMQSVGKYDPLKYAISADSASQISEWVNQRPDAVHSYVQFLQFSGMITDGKTQLVVVGSGNDHKYSQKMRQAFAWDAKYGTPLEAEPKPLTALLGVQLGSWMGCLPNPTVELNLELTGYPPVIRPFKCSNQLLQVTALTESGQINALNFSIKGLADGGIREIDSRLLLTDLKSIQTLLNTNKITYATLKWNSGVNQHESKKELNKLLKSIDENLHSVSWKEHEDGILFAQSMEILNVFRYFVVIIVLLIAGMSVFNTSIKSVIERVKEIGTLLSLGFKQIHVLQIFLVESLITCLIGNIFGCIIATSITALLNSLNIGYRAGIYTEATLIQINFIPLAFFNAAIVTFIVSGLTTYFAVKYFINKRIIQNLNG